MQPRKESDQERARWHSTGNLVGVTKLSQTFHDLKSKGEKALVVFVTAGDPTLEALPEILLALQEGGADIIEVGLPFSDPIADGPVIQAASHRALTNGVTRTKVMAVLAGTPLNVPVIAMGYYNTMLRPGLEAFATEARHSHVSGTIVCDIIPEEATEWITVSRAIALDTVFLAAPTSTDDRLDAVAHQSTGFVYAVARTGVTGAATAQADETVDLITKLKARTEVPVCVGFGVRSPEQVKQLSQVADGVVVGSSLVQLIADKWPAGRDEVVQYVRSLKEATRG